MKTILVDAIHAFIVEVESGYGIFEPMKQLLDEFPNPKIILTGANDEQFKKFGLDKMPYKVFTLRHEPEKNDPEYYRKMLDHFNLKAEDVVCFEHKLEAVESAKSVGIKTFLWDDAKRPLEELHNFLETALA